MLLEITKAFDSLIICRLYAHFDSLKSHYVSCKDYKKEEFLCIKKACIKVQLDCHSYQVAMKN